MAVMETEWGEWTGADLMEMVTWWHDCRVTYRWEFSAWRGTGRVWVRVFTPNGQSTEWGVGPPSPHHGHRTLAHYRTEVQASVEQWWAQRVAARLGALA